MRPGKLDRSERPAGPPGATLVMGHSATRFRGGGRFNGEALGAWHCATDIETAIAGTVYHQTMSLAHSASEFCHQT